MANESSSRTAQVGRTAPSDAALPPSPRRMPRSLLSLRLEATATAAATARRAVADALIGCEVGEDVRDTVVLLADELVTNAVVHARTSLQLDLVVTATEIRAIVTDASSVVPRPRSEVVLAPEDLAEGGRGLRLVELLSTRWGVEPIASGKRIWFTVRSDSTA